MRIKLSEKYQKEREEICNKIISILDLKEDNTILLCHLDEDVEKQNKILDLENVGHTNNKDQMNSVFLLFHHFK
jgi:hypothetical protein